jgi:pimeloyl-ACP methyl ester carboxylesterase
MSEVTERDLLVGGIRTVLAESGPAGEPEAIVFVHGNPGSARDWRDLMGRTGDFARSLAMDMPCFGRAEKPQDFPVPVEGWARWLGQALDELGVRRAHLVLHDFGGPWGLGWAAEHRDALASVVLIDTGILIGLENHPTGKLWARPVVGELVMRATTRGAFKRALLRGDARPLPEAYIDEMYDTYDHATRRTVLRLYRNRPGDEELRVASALFGELDPPALVIWGGKDPFLPTRHAEQQRESFPSARVEILQDSGHWPFADDPQRVAELVVPFLRERVSPAGSA